jgi:hypothetical protein
MKIKKDNYAISEMLGTILLLLIAVSSFAVVQANILFNPITQDQTFVTIVGEVKGNNILLLHRGGEPLSLKTKINFEIDGNVYNIIVGENNYLTSEFKADGLWNIGESLIFTPGLDLTNLDVKVTVLDVETNTVLMSETI